MVRVKLLDAADDDDYDERKWAGHYSSMQEILVVGDGDFSFSRSLAEAFGSATNIVATSLDTRAELIKKYSKAKDNLKNLKKLGAALIHGVDATKMRVHPDLRARKFDVIVFNFPHAGFRGKEDHLPVINAHKKLIFGFFNNANHMLRPHGEVHISHKTTGPFTLWNLEELASRCSLVLAEKVKFNTEDYPGYNNKRGDSKRCDEPFPLGECSTFKFRIGPPSKRKMVGLFETSFDAAGLGWNGCHGDDRSVMAGGRRQFLPFDGSLVPRCLPRCIPDMGSVPPNLFGPPVYDNRMQWDFTLRRMPSPSVSGGFGLPIQVRHQVDYFNRLSFPRHPLTNPEVYMNGAGPFIRSFNCSPPSPPFARQAGGPFSDHARYDFPRFDTYDDLHINEFARRTQAGYCRQQEQLVIAGRNRNILLQSAHSDLPVLKMANEPRHCDPYGNPLY